MFPVHHNSCFFLHQSVPFCLTLMVHITFFYAIVDFFSNFILERTNFNHYSANIFASLKNRENYIYMVQIFQPWIQRRKLEYIKHRHVILGLLRHLKMHSLGRLLRDDGEPDKEVIRK